MQGLRTECLNCVSFDQRESNVPTCNMYYVVFEFVFDNNDDGDEVEVGIEVDEEGSSRCACAMMVLIDYYVEVEETNWARSLPLLLVAIVLQ
jgi:hypothetical protein